MAPERTRFAPSPTGDLHLGGAYVALASFWLARSTGGAMVLRVEDLDRRRVVSGAEESQLEDLAWLGLSWDEGPARQSDRIPLYEEALAALTRLGRIYPCDCSRAEIARVASAPHDGDDVAYPGTCREKDPLRELRRPAALRLRLEPGDAVEWADGVLGPADPGLVFGAGDFVLRRGDGVFAYQLAVAVDDLAMGITAVIRGDDLVPSTPRQLLLMRLFSQSSLAHSRGRSTPRYWHVPLVRAGDGSRLAKRTSGATVRDLRAMGVPPARVVGALAHALGLARTAAPLTPGELVERGPAGASFSPVPWRIPATW